MAAKQILENFGQASPKKNKNNFQQSKNKTKDFAYQAFLYVCLKILFVTSKLRML